MTLKSKNKILWKPSQKQIKTTHIYQFIERINSCQNLKIINYQQLHKWSVEFRSLFWQHVWDYCGIISKKIAPNVVENEDSFQNAKWFPGALLNYAENLLQKNDESIALVFNGEGKVFREISWKKLNEDVSCFQQYFRKIGLVAGDRVAFYMPNMPETIVCMLAAASIGLVCSLCSPDFGVQAVVDRFGQIKPKLLLFSDKYIYNNKIILMEEKSYEIIHQINSIKNSICISYEQNLKDDYYTILNEFKPIKIEFDYFSCQHPLYILYSSGTTGIPKCIVHSVGGTLLQHAKEHQLQCNIQPGDKVFYFTTCGWMMWHWLVGSLFSKATLLLYDGSPFYPDMNILFNFIEKENCTFFGTSAKFIDSLRKNNFTILNKFKLKYLRTIGSTGSPLSPDNYNYVYSQIKKNVCLSSMSGGTDIISCFVLGNPLDNVVCGEIQGPGLGMDVQIFNEQGQSVQGQTGELVCVKPFPSQPIYFWNDSFNVKLNKTYFEKYKNVWHHGDWAEFTINKGFIIFGRSDSTLNPGGVRIGTAEIYRQVEKFDDILESVVVEQFWKNENRVILFVVLKHNCQLTENLVNLINLTLKTSCSPRHVPAKIISVPEIPKTKSGKIMELAVKNVINNKDVNNKDVMVNPDCLAYFLNCPSLLMD